MATMTSQAIALDHVTNGEVLAAAVTGSRHEILGFVLSGDGTGRVKLVAGSTVLTAFEAVAGANVVLPPGDHRLYGGSGSNLNLVTTGGVNVSGHVLVLTRPV